MRTTSASRARATSPATWGDAVAAGEPPVAAALQILTTEHWSLLSTRSLTWNESFSRATMFLSTITGSLVAVALIAQASAFRRESLWFALAILLIALCVGVATFARLVDVNREDVLWVRGMNRLRSAYIELAPDLARFLVASPDDDDAGVLQTLGAGSDTSPLYHHLLGTTPVLVAMIDAAIAGAIGAMIALLAGVSAEWTIAISVSLFVAAGTILLRYQLRASSFVPHRADVRPDRHTGSTHPMSTTSAPGSA